jgi:hypothetical protein
MLITTCCNYESEIYYELCPDCKEHCDWEVIDNEEWELRNEYENQIKENKTTKLEILQTNAWETPEELEQWQKGVAQWLNERRSKKATKKTLTTNKTKKQ